MPVLSKRSEGIRTVTVFVERVLLWQSANVKRIKTVENLGMVHVLPF